MTLLRVEQVSKAFGGVDAITDVNFDVTAGRIHSIIGPNGAGKTTLLNLITGIYRPNDGRILFEKADITRLPPHALAVRGISRTFQNLQIFHNMSALENVMVGRHLHADTRFLPTLFRAPSVRRSDAETRDKAEELMAFVGLEAYLGEDADSLPYGGLKRLEIARALAAEPKLLLLDEPAAGCNPRETAEIEELLQKLTEAGVTVVLVEHNMRLVMGVSDHIVVLDYGRKLAEGTAEAVRTNPEVIAAYLGTKTREEG